MTRMFCSRWIAPALAILSLLAGCAQMPSTPASGAAAGATGVTPPVATGSAAGVRMPQVPAAPAPDAGGRPAVGGPPLQPLTSTSLGNAPTVAAITAPRDLWERMRRGFAMPDLQGDLVRDREQWYATRPDYIARMSDRSSKYLFHIVEELERRGMPTELALLPFIESAFNPQAVSSAKAAGMWQFIPSTGRHFELKQNMFRDDRRDVLASTRAALDYLQRLYGMFGDWQLALAAYNWGEGNVGRARARNERNGLPTTYADLNMPAETRLYVPKLQAVKNIVANPAALGVRLPNIPNHPYFQEVAITRDIDVEVAARLAEVRIEDFKALNPSAHKPVILASGTPQILLPWDNAVDFVKNLNAYSGKLATWTAWVAPRNMKVSEVAHAVGMQEGELRSVNHIPPGMLVKGGSTLLVHRSASGERARDVPEKLADNAQLSLTPEIVLRKSTVKARKGDTPASLAKRHNVTVAKLLEWNHFGATAVLKAGQPVVLMLPVPAHRGGSASRNHAKSRR